MSVVRLRLSNHLQQDRENASPKTQASAWGREVRRALKSRQDDLSVADAALKINRADAASLEREISRYNALRPGSDLFARTCHMHVRAYVRAYVRAHRLRQTQSPLRSDAVCPAPQLSGSAARCPAGAARRGSRRFCDACDASCADRP